MTQNNQAILHFNSANNLYKSQLFTEALNLYKKAIEEDLSFYEAHFCVVKSLIRLGELADGIAHFEKYKNLIPNNEIITYSFGLSSIIEQEFDALKALEFVDSIIIEKTDKLDFRYLTLLVKNNLIDKYYSLILQISDAKKALNLQKEVLKDNLNEKLKLNIVQDNLLESFHKNKLAFSELKQIINNSEEWLKKINSLKEQIKSIQENKVDHIKNNDILTIAIESVYQDLHSQLLKVEKISKPQEFKAMLNVLSKSGFAKSKLELLNNRLNEHYTRKRNSFIKKTVIGLALIFILISSGVLLKNWNEKRLDFQNAINTDSFEAYSAFLDKHGKDDIIDKRRENILYKNCLKQNLSENINKFYAYYPKSDYLRKVNFLNSEDYYILLRASKNDNDLIRTQTDKKGEYWIPYNSRVYTEITAYNKLPIQKSFQVADNLSINISFVDEKKLYLNEEFKNNSRNWSLEHKTKKFWGGEITEMEVKIEENKLCFENNTYDNLLYSKINTGLNSTDDYEIELSFESKDYRNNGVYLLFALKNQAFLFFKVNSGNYAIGHNDWDDNDNSWKDWTSGTTRHNTNAKDGYLKIIKKKKKISYYLNDHILEEIEYKKYYGSQIGVGVNGRFAACINYVKVYKYNTYEKSELEDGKVYYCSASELNVRASGGNSDVIAKIIEGEPIKYLGKHSQNREKVSFLDEEFDEYYYQIETLNGIIGWVHGGGLNSINTLKELRLSDFKLDLLNPIKEENQDKELETKKVTPIETPSEQLKNIPESNNQIEVMVEETKPTKTEETKLVKSTCLSCKGKGKTSKNCNSDGCQNGFISATCTTCNGNYRSGKGICPNPGCNFVGCEYCDYDGAACTKCNRGKITIQHSKCNGTGKIHTSCGVCSGKGYTIK